jgi:arylsulfatase A-like enzyme
MEGKPGLYGRVKAVYRDIDEEGWRRLRACYYALLTELDTQLGRLLDFLEASGQLDRTIVVFASDHGRYLGAHGMDAHNFAAFEDAYRVPLVIAGPGIRADATASGYASLVDLGATITDLCGAEVLETADSQSLRPLLEHDGASSIPESFRSCYAEYHGTRFPLMQRILWRDNWKYVYNGFDRDEMYDLQADPYELENVAEDPRYREVADDLMRRVWQRIHRTGDRALIETHYSPMRFARVGPLLGAEPEDGLEDR